MPKDWRLHEATIRQLYREGKTLKEVRRILASDFGFNASVRAYRMRYFEWGLNKSSFTSIDKQLSRKPTGHEKQPLSQLELFLESDIDTPQTLTRSEANAFNGPSFRVSDHKGRDDLEFENFPSMLEHWRPDGAYFKKAIALLSKEPSWKECLIDPTPDLFKSIDDTVAIEEKIPLTKACLVASFGISTTGINIEDFWRGWKDATSGVSWEAAKEILLRECFAPALLGNTFLDCAFMVVAESLLKACMNRLEALRQRIEPLDERESIEAANLREKYMYILNDFKDAQLDDPLYYRYSLHIGEWNKATTDATAKNKVVLPDLRAPVPGIPAMAEVDHEPFNECSNPNANTPRVQSTHTAATPDQTLGLGRELTQKNSLEPALTALLSCWHSEPAALTQRLEIFPLLLNHLPRSHNAEASGELFDLLLNCVPIFIDSKYQIPFTKSLLLSVESLIEKHHQWRDLAGVMGWVPNYNEHS